MTENKQYYVVQDNLGEYSVLKGEEMELICPELEHKSTGELFCYELNDLAEENMELKKENQELRMSPRVDTNEIESLVCENEKLKNRINELEEKVYHNLAWFLMYQDYFGIDLGETIWNNAEIENHEQEREKLNEYISIAKKRYVI